MASDDPSAEYRRSADRVNNWGRWGDEDRRGTLNLVDGTAVSRAAAAVRRGVGFPLAVPLSEDGPQAGFVPGRHNPRRTMTAIDEPAGGDDTIGTSDDRVDMALQDGTHWDALAHVSHRGRLYNGVPADTIDDRGAHQLGIDRVGALVTRGVLLDVARAHGVERLHAGHGITPGDLDAAEELTGTGLRPGDAVLVRTGQIQHFHAGDRGAYAHPSPGLTMACAAWFHDRDVAAVATDNLTLEVFPGEHDGLFLPVHRLHLVEMGMLQGQNFDLEELAADCAAEGSNDFLLSATPEPFVRGLGAPVAPVAVR